MPSFHIAKSVSIQANPEKIYAILCDYHHWLAWSPWLILETGVKVEVNPNGKAYTWNGKRTGSGEMKVLQEDPPLRMDMVVQFLKPWKSTSPVRFELKPQGDVTEVIWYMDGSLPFFMFWMTKMMTAYVGMDYQRGLMMLKDFVETGAVPSKLEFKGVSQYAGCLFVGIKTSCTTETLGPTMAEDFKRLGAWVSQHATLVSGNAFSIYHKWDILKKKQVMYTSAFPVKEIPKDLPKGFVSGSIPATRVNTVSHTGPYRHLGNAWSAQYLMQRSKEFKHRKRIDPFETYTNMPGSVPENDLITQVNFPVV